MDGGDTQLIDYSPQRSPSHSSVSGESTASDGHLHEPTQLLYTQLLDHYEGRMDKARNVRHLHLDMETQLIDDNNFEDFRKDGTILPSEDEASKETQLVHGDEVHSGSSSGKDGEVDSALSPLSAAFRQKTPQWLSELTHRDRSIECVGGRAPQISCPYRARYLGDTQILSEDVDGKVHDLAAKEQKNFVNSRAGIGVCPDSQCRDVDVPHFLRRFDPIVRDFAGQRMMGGWQEVVGNRGGANEYDRGGWDSAMRGLQVADSDASTEDEEHHNNPGFSAGLSSLGAAHLPQKTNSRMATHVSSNFCSQDLNKSPEPETLMDEWDNGNAVDHGLGRVEEGEPNMALSRIEQVEPCFPSNVPPVGSRSSEGLNENVSSTIRLTARTPGSIRAASLRASALQAMACCSSERRRYVQGSKSEEVEKIGGDQLPEMLRHVADSSRRSERDGLMVDACMRGAASCIVGHEVTKSTENPAKKGRVLHDGDETNHGIQCSKDKNEGALRHPNSEAIGTARTLETEVSNLGMNGSRVGQKPVESRSSYGSRMFSTGSDMCSMNLQSPGEDSQATALNMVDKLVWLNAIGLPRELQLEENKDKDKAPVLAQGHSKSVFRSRAQMAEAKAGKSGPLGVFDWDDSQNDEAGAMFGGASGKNNAGSKGSVKPSVVSGPSRQIDLGLKKCSASDGEAGQNRKVAKDVTSNLNRQDEFMCKSLSVVMENKPEQCGGRPGNSSDAADNRPECAGVGQSRNSLHLHQAKIGDKMANEVFPDKSLMKFGTVDKGIVSTLPHQSGNRNLIEQEKLSNEPGHTKEHLVTASAMSKTIDVHTGKDIKVSGQGGSDTSSKDFCDAEASLMTPDASEGSALHVLDETSAPEESDERNDMQNGVDVDFPHLVDNGMHRIGTKADRGNSTVVDLACSNQVLEGLDDEETGLERPLKRSKISVGAICTANGSRVMECLTGQQQGNADTVQPSLTSETGRRHSNPSENTLQATKIRGIADRKGARGVGNLEGKLEALVNGREGSVVHGDIMASSPSQDVHGGEDSRMATDEPPEAMKVSHSDVSDVQLVRKHRNGSDEITSEMCSSRQDIEDERKSDSEEDMQFVSKVAQATARRGRSQTRYGVTLSGHTDPQCHVNKFMHPKKGRRRRVTWAGPLVQVPKQNVGIRGHRTLKWEDQERRDEDDVEAEDSSEQEEDEAVEIKETRSANGARKRNTATLEMSSRDSDLAKIKKRFNMSDGAVARLLGTDEEDNAGLNQALKVRSLSHIRPHSDEIESTGPLSVRKVGKGLRSARNRSEIGCKRLWPFLITDQAKSEWEDVDSPRDELVEDGNVDETTILETHPSDNEVLTGRRRMRSIADVSFPSLSLSTSGRPSLPQGLRRRRGRHLVKSPREASPDLSDDELGDVPPCAPPTISPVFGQLRGKGGPRSARKRKECEFERLAVMSEGLSPNPSKEVSPTGFKRPKRAGTTCVLLSHGLNQDSLKLQGKIVTRLGGRVASNASDCTHFVADKFVRTGNMLEAMACGKPVVTMEWLQKCLEANRFLSEDDFILEDKKKEEELGFSMVSTLAAARQRPLLQGMKVYITPGTSPGPDSLAKIIKSAGGQVVDNYKGPVVTGGKESDICVVISSDEEFEDCIPLLEQGAKVYTPELLLSGVTNYHLDFSNDQLFKNFTRRRRRGSASRRTV